MAKLIDWRQREDELSEAVAQIGICLAQAIHEGDPNAAQRMNFTAAKIYSRLVDEGRPLAADIVYRFGRALMDRQLFPNPATPDQPAPGEPAADGQVS